MVTGHGTSSGGRDACCYCNKKKRNFPQLHFHRFPTDPERSKLWVQNACLADLVCVPSRVLNDTHRLCSLHFEPNQFTTGAQKALNRNAIPTVFLNEETNASSGIKPANQHPSQVDPIPQEQEETIVADASSPAVISIGRKHTLNTRQVRHPSKKKHDANIESYMRTKGPEVHMKLEYTRKDLPPPLDHLQQDTPDAVKISHHTVSNLPDKEQADGALPDLIKRFKHIKTRSSGSLLMADEHDTPRASPKLLTTAVSAVVRIEKSGQIKIPQLRQQPMQLTTNNTMSGQELSSAAKLDVSLKFKFSYNNIIQNILNTKLELDICETQGRIVPKLAILMSTWAWKQGRGLTNLGNTCYINSVLQSLMHNKTFCVNVLQAFLSHAPACTSRQTCVLCFMTEIISQSKEPASNGPFVPVKLINNLKVVCSSCGERCNSETTGLDLPVSMNAKVKSVQLAFNNVIRQASVMRHCANCCLKTSENQPLVDHKLNYQLCSIPDVLVINILRCPEMFAGRRRERYVPIQVEQELVVPTPFTPSHNTKYKIQSIVSHLGKETNSGHYICTVFGPTGVTKFDDAKVICSSTVDTDAAYVLFYDKVDELLDAEIHPEVNKSYAYLDEDMANPDVVISVPNSHIQNEKCEDKSPAATAKQATKPQEKSFSITPIKTAPSTFIPKRKTSCSPSVRQEKSVVDSHVPLQLAVKPSGKDSKEIENTKKLNQSRKSTRTSGHNEHPSPHGLRERQSSHVKTNARHAVNPKRNKSNLPIQQITYSISNNENECPSQLCEVIENTSVPTYCKFNKESVVATYGSKRLDTNNTPKTLNSKLVEKQVVNICEAEEVPPKRKIQDDKFCRSPKKIRLSPKMINLSATKIPPRKCEKNSAETPSCTPRNKKRLLFSEGSPSKQSTYSRASATCEVNETCCQESPLHNKNNDMVPSDKKIEPQKRMLPHHGLTMDGVSPLEGEGETMDFLISKVPVTVSPHVDGNKKRQKKCPQIDLKAVLTSMGVSKKSECTPRRRKVYDDILKQLRKYRSLCNAVEKKKKIIKSLCNTKGAIVQEALENNFSPEVATILKCNILYNKNKSARGFKWPSDAVSQSLVWYQSSPQGYRTFRSAMVLPCETTLRENLAKIKLEPGLNDNITMNLEHCVKNFTLEQKVCILLMDEKSLMKFLSVSPKGGYIVGFEDFGEFGRTHRIADNALILLLKGLLAPWKFPLQFSYCCGMTPGEICKEILLQGIRKARKCGLLPYAVSSDQGANFRKAYRLLGASEEKPYFFVDGKMVVVSFDAGHLIKGTRNGCEKDGLSIDGIKLLWKYIRLFYNWDKRQPLRHACNLRSRHFKTQWKSAMKVLYAVQILSHSVAIGMYDMAKSLERRFRNNRAIYAMKKMSIAIEWINKMFDSLNGTLSPRPCSSLYRGPLTDKSKHLALWKKLIPWVKKWDFRDRRGQTRPTKSGWIWTMQSLIVLWGELKKLGVKEFATGNVGTDVMENFNGLITHNCGSNPNPTVVQFEAAYKTSLVNIVTKNQSRKSNCQEDDLHPILDFKKLLADSKTVTGRIDEELYVPSAIDVEIENITPETLRLAMHQCRHTMDKLLKRSKCETCKLTVIDTAEYSDTSYIKVMDFDKPNNFASVPKEIFAVAYFKLLMLLKRVIPMRASNKNLFVFLEYVIDNGMDLSWMGCLPHKFHFQGLFKNIIIRHAAQLYCDEQNATFKDARCAGV